MQASDPPPDEAPALEALLRWYAAMGVDATIDEDPHDRFLPPPPEAAREPSPPSSRVAPTGALPVRGPAREAAPRAIQQPAEALVAEAEALAAGAVDLADLRARWEAVPGCRLGASSRMIFDGGTPGATLMLVGGQPDEDDEREGAPFAGAPGRLLDAMLRAIGLSRTQVTLGHVVPWRPPGGRAPTPLELASCLPFARRRIAMSRPTILLCLGDRAAQPLLGTSDTISRLRGRWLGFEGESEAVKTLVTFAPGYLLKQPLQKRRAWADLLMVEDAMEAIRRRDP